MGRMTAVDIGAGLIAPTTWEALADGRVHRLKRGKHFRGDVRALTKAAALEAGRMGRAVRCMRDEFGKLQYLWVQFADHQIPVGAPCPRCDSRELLRTHEFFGRCPRCGATFVFDGEVAAGTIGSGAAAPRSDLLRYRDVRIKFVDRWHDHERWAGHGLTADGIPVLLIVDYPVDAQGARIEALNAGGEYVHRVRAFPLSPFAEALDLSAMFPEAEARPVTAPPGDA